ncbi:MAG: type II toxin-antitoxin system HicB family antitoxin [Candidatus Brocadiales bacterium]
MNLQLIIELWKKGSWFLARAPELDFISQGKTPEEAKRNLIKVIGIQFEEMKDMGTLEEYLLECGFEIKGDELTPQGEMIGFEKSVISVS